MLRGLGVRVRAVAALSLRCRCAVAALLRGLRVLALISLSFQASFLKPPGKPSLDHDVRSRLLLPLIQILALDMTLVITSSAIVYAWLKNHYFGTRARTNTIPYGTEASAAG